MPEYLRICAFNSQQRRTSHRHGGVQWGNRDVAAALREGIMGVRADNLKQPLNWVQFVHYGA
jgi:hypothetical protein